MDIVTDEEVKMSLTVIVAPYPASAIGHTEKYYTPFFENPAKSAKEMASA